MQPPYGPSICGVHTVEKSYVMGYIGIWYTFHPDVFFTFGSLKYCVDSCALLNWCMCLLVRTGIVPPYLKNVRVVILQLAIMGSHFQCCRSAFILLVDNCGMSLWAFAYFGTGLHCLFLPFL